ncbi:MAG: tetratricopeptide repeat protein, partial [Kiritimatiellia bacterium]|nr:tetratricopeptide repeat protein [Kiritimatiellia bacterium]
ARSLYSRGLIRYRLGDFEAALRDFEETEKAYAESSVLEQTGYAEQALFMQGWCHALAGQTDRALELCDSFTRRFPNSRWAPDVRFWIGETLFNRGDFESAERTFAELGRSQPPTALSDRALFWAGRSAVRANNPAQAVLAFNDLARDFPNSPMLPEARFEQGDALRALGQFSAAILVFEDIVLHFPNSYLANPARLRIGDLHYSLAAEDGSRYPQAILAYRSLRDSVNVPADLLWEAEFKAGRCYERMDRAEDAFEAYMQVVYEQVQAVQDGRPGNDLWFSRAAFHAAALKEKAGEWREAAGIYRRIIETGSSAADDAQNRLNRLRLEPWRNF